MTGYNDENKGIKPMGEEEILFEKVTGMFSKESVDSLYKVMADTGISKKNIELWKVLVALELYKGYYETIPRDIKGVRNDLIKIAQETKDDLLKITYEIKSEFQKTEANIKKLAKQTEQSSATCQMALSEFEAMGAKKIEGMAQKAEKSMRATTKTITESVRDALTENKKIVDELKQSTNENWKIAKKAGWFHLRYIAPINLIAFVILGLGLWTYIHFDYERRYEEKQMAYISELIPITQENARILQELAVSKRELILTTDKSGLKQIIIKRAEKAGRDIDGSGYISFK